MKNVNRLQKNKINITSCGCFVYNRPKTNTDTMIVFKESLLSIIHERKEPHEFVSTFLYDEELSILC